MQIYYNRNLSVRGSGQYIIYPRLDVKVEAQHSLTLTRWCSLVFRTGPQQTYPLVSADITLLGSLSQPSFASSSPVSSFRPPAAMGTGWCRQCDKAAVDSGADTLGAPAIGRPRQGSRDTKPG